MAMQINSISPSSGPPAGGTTVTIVGFGFTGATQVTFNGVNATGLVVDSDTQVHCVSPAGTGLATVRLFGSGGNASMAGFTYGTTLTSITPAQGTTAGGSPVTITGTGLTGTTVVQIGAANATNMVLVSSTSITCKTPPGTAGATNVLIYNPAGNASMIDAFVYVAPPPIIPPPPPSCVRSAWLVLNGVSIQLENPAAGYFCTSLDLGYPTARDVVSNRPDRDGVDDRTMYSAARTVSANITALVGAGATHLDAIGPLFAPFMVPSARPVLHYILDRPGVGERTLTLRPSNYSGPITGPYQRDIQLQWVTSGDPIAQDPAISSVTAWAGSSTTPGRLYPLVEPRTYPLGSAAATAGYIRTYGDQPVKPRLIVYGPITQPVIALTGLPGNTPKWTIRFLPSFTLSAGQWVDIDTSAKTAYLNGDPTQSVLASIDWANTQWPNLLVMPSYTLLQLIGTSTNDASQVVASWHDRYLV